MTSTPKRLISMFSGVLNWRRMLAADSVVEEVRKVGSRSTTTIRPSKSGRAARKVATADADDRAADDDDVGPVAPRSWRGSYPLDLQAMAEPKVRFADDLPATADVVVIGGGIDRLRDRLLCRPRRTAGRRPRAARGAGDPDHAGLDRRLPAPVRQPRGDRHGARGRRAVRRVRGAQRVSTAGISACAMAGTCSAP